MLTLQAHCLQDAQDQVAPAVQEQCACYKVSHQAMTNLSAIVLTIDDGLVGCPSSYIAEQGLHTIVSVPLVAQGQAVGVLTLGTPRANAVPQPELDLLTAIGQQTGIAIENARLYQEAERRAEELTLLRQVSISLTSTLDPDEIYDQIAEQSTKLLGCQVACIVVPDREQRKIEIVSSYGISKSASHVLETQTGTFSILANLTIEQRSIAIEDVQNDPRVPPAWRDNARALLCLPIWSAEEPLGFLFLADRQAPRRWRSEEIGLIESFVSRAAVALVNARLHKQLEWAAALEERQRIAANMHDGLAQTLSLVGLKVDQVTELVDSGSSQDAARELHDIRQTVEQASSQVRRSIASLQETPQPRRSLQDLLSDLVGQFFARGGPVIELALNVKEPLFLSSDHRTQVLPIVQEALLNAQRHARARQIALTLSRRRGDIRITVQDDGQGFDPDALRDQGGHFGLSIMRARAARIGGKLEIDAEPGQGTRVSLSWTLAGNGDQTHTMPIQISTP
ncbi:MAG: GAF domain-containing sensor histidine kinase [Anaerolineae bacterium]|nr:GAF domain-containing sensor histidine kinase [Anaerolineae bacterium]